MSTAPTETAFPSSLPTSYVPAEHEDPIRARWDASGIFHAEPPQPGEVDRPSYCILIPPPNVTAALHLGHAFNNTLQDVLVRHHRMRGDRTLWMPGTDHAGIATQTVVEKRLLARGEDRRTMGRTAFIERVQAWKDEYEAVITGQLRALGASCDWDRQRFTMDPLCARAVREAFFRLFDAGLIYRGKRLVNWDPITQTALADDEVEMREVDGTFYYLRYPLVDAGGQPTGETVTVATTRPETMLGDTGVAVNPSDATRARFAGQHVRLPIVGRVVPIVADDYVVIPDADSADAKAQFASGFLKVTPAHDANDWEIGQRHGLDTVNILAPDGSISDRHGWEDVSDEARQFVGMSRDDARAAVIEWFRAHDLLESTRPYRHSVGHSYRSHAPVEPYLSDQWYVRVTDDRLVGEAERALAPDQRETQAPRREAEPPAAAALENDGTLHFHPARYAKSYEAWHTNLRDWCISRQLWWGHQIPVWSQLCSDAAEAERLLAAWKARAAAHPEHAAVQSEATPDGHLIQVCLGVEDDTTAELQARAEADGFVRDEDVLDTWFSSGLWPLSTMGWPDPDGTPETAGLLSTFNPTSVLCTARDIITLWVSRMVMFNRHFNAGRVPFRDVYIHPMIQDGYGQRMSKSLGNGVDPRDIIASHGADAVRFTLVQMATSTQDARLPVDTVCPHCTHAFHPHEITSPAGYRVAAPEQACPDCGKPMVSAYGVAVGSIEPSTAAPLARNTSSRFDQGRNFANKLWNATRFALGKLGTAENAAGPEVAVADLGLVDRWMIARLHRTLHAAEDAIASYQFSAYADAMYDLVWRDFCDWYLEAIKPTVDADPRQRQALRTVLDAILRLLHPVCPFVTEALWSALSAHGAAGLDGVELPPCELLAEAAWPDIACRVDDKEGVQTFERVQALVNDIRTLRGEHRVKPRRRITLHATEAVRVLIDGAGGVVETLAGLESVAPIRGERPGGAVALTFDGAEQWLTDLVDAVDVDAERERLGAAAEEKRRAAEGFRKRLSNAGYVNNAPPAVVEETRRRLAEAEADLLAAERALEALG